jgi:tRNA pseudouridine38-40 synthase
MPRYFLEVSYKGTNYSGFQTQKNANSIQDEVEKAFLILQKEKVLLTGSSRTDTGVHALQNFFHFDSDSPLHLWRGTKGEGDEAKFVYKINAILPGDIVVKSIFPVSPDAHCRFDAVSREYKYFIYREKNPFLNDRAFYFPYKLNMENLQKAAAILKRYEDFTSFSKRNTQVKTFTCQIQTSEWLLENGCLVYHVKGNRFLRGMVRALTATMLKVGRGTIDLEEFAHIIEAKDCTQASFAVPPHGLFLTSVEFSSVNE